MNKLIGTLSGLLALAASSAEPTPPPAVHAALPVVWGKAPAEVYRMGLVVWKSGGAGLLLASLPPDAHLRPGGLECAVILGPGSKSETRVPAVLAARDQELGLAVLRVETPALPEPLSLSVSAECREAQPVKVWGYAPPARSPPAPARPVVHSGAVSALRRDEAGDLAWIQLDLAISRAALGGPVVDASGACLGMPLLETPGTQIVRALPVLRMAEVLAGRPGALHFEVADRQEHRQFKVHVRAELLDPLANLKRVRLLLFAKPDSDGRPQAANKTVLPLKGAPALAVELALDGARATGELVLGGAADRFRFQLEWEHKDGSLRRAVPQDLRLVASLSDPLPAATGIGVGPAGQPVKTGIRLFHGRCRLADAVCYSLEVDAPRTFPCLLMSSDGRFAYALEEPGLLRKIAVPGLTEERQIYLGAACTGMCQSKAGLVVGIRQPSELWVLDQDTLAVTKRMPGPLAVRLASSPLLDHAYVTGDASSVTVMDLVVGKPIKQHKYDELDPSLRWQRMEDFAVSRDGRYFFAMSIGLLARFAATGADLVFEEATDIGRTHVAGLCPRIEVSPDSAYIAPVRQKNGEPWLTILRTRDFGTPVLKLRAETDPLALGYDKTRGKLYSASTFGGALRVHDLKGTLEKAYRWPQDSWGSDLPRQIVVHPDGGRALLLTTKYLLWMEFP